MVTVSARPLVGTAISGSSALDGTGVQPNDPLPVEVRMLEEISWPFWTNAVRLLTAAPGPKPGPPPPGVNGEPVQANGVRYAGLRELSGGWVNFCCWVSSASTCRTRYRLRKTSVVTPMTAHTAVISATIPMINFA